jgi:hypothetical protein
MYMSTRQLEILLCTKPSDLNNMILLAYSVLSDINRRHPEMSPAWASPPAPRPNNSQKVRGKKKTHLPFPVGVSVLPAGARPAIDYWARRRSVKPSSARPVAIIIQSLGSGTSDTSGTSEIVAKALGVRPIGWPGCRLNCAMSPEVGAR